RIPVVDPESGRPVTPQCSRQKQAVPIRIVKSSEVRNLTPRFHRLAPAGDTRGCIDGFDQVVGIGSGVEGNRIAGGLLRGITCQNRKRVLVKLLGVRSRIFEQPVKAVSIYAVSAASPC